MIGLTFTNGIVVGFEFSLKHRIMQLHLTCVSVVFVWGLDEEEEDGES